MRRLILLAASTLLAAVTLFAGNPTDYLRWMQENLPECLAFDDWQRRTGTLPPDFEALPRTNLLPDAFTFADGRPVVTEEDWQRRRAEIRDLFIRYEFGTMPPKPAITRVDRMEETRGEGWRSLTVCL